MQTFRFAAAAALALGIAGCALNVRTVGNASGSVTSDNAKINCGSSGTDCREVTFNPATYTLQAAANNGAIFTGWGGACTGMGPCLVTTDASKTVFAYFQTPLAVGAYHVCAIRFGAIFCWGSSSDGQLGRGTTPSPGQDPSSVFGVRLSALAIAAGGFHSCAILGDGSVNCWGLGADGQLGNGVSGGEVRAVVPVVVTGIGPDRPVALAAGGYHTCALLSSGRVQCWGFNKNGQAGSGSPNAPAQVTTATLVSGINNAIAITAGAFHSCALLADNTVRCWGRDDNGELGDAPRVDTAVPVTARVGRTLTETLNDLTAVAAGIGVGVLGLTQLGGYHTCAVKSDGTAVCWGYHRGGVLGNGTLFNDFDSVFVLFPNAVPVQTLMGSARAIAGGGYHNCVLLTNGLIQCWGNGGNGQIGNNANSSTGSPTTTTLPPGRLGVGLAAGGYQTCALLAPSATTNEVWCWGNNGEGQLGDGSYTDRVTPVRVNVP